MSERHQRVLLRGTALLVALLAVYCGRMLFAAHQPRLVARAAGAEEPEATTEGEEAAPEGFVPFSGEQVEKYGVTLGQAGPGTLRSYIALPGEIRMDADHVAHVVLPVTGYAQEISKSLGDTVHAGEPMAVFKSRELADARAAYAAAQTRAGIAQAALKREKSLYEQKISPQQDLLDAERECAEAGIAMRSAEQQLRTLGYKDSDFKAAGKQANEMFSRFVLEAPMDGQVIEKHIALGELIKVDTPAFIVADLSSVWADFTVTQQELARVRAGQTVSITSDAGKPPVDAKISYLGPIVSSDTRTALARAVVGNADGAWIPGQFITGRILVESKGVPVMVPQAALQTVDGMSSAFVKVDDGFEVRPVKLGRTTDDGVEVVSGLDSGETFATGNTFVLKAQLGKGEAGHEEE